MSDDEKMVVVEYGAPLTPERYLEAEIPSEKVEGLAYTDEAAFFQGRVNGIPVGQLLDVAVKVGAIAGLDYMRSPGIQARIGLDEFLETRLYVEINHLLGSYLMGRRNLLVGCEETLSEVDTIYKAKIDAEIYGFVEDDGITGRERIQSLAGTPNMTTEQIETPDGYEEATAFIKRFLTKKYN